MGWGGGGRGGGENSRVRLVLTYDVEPRTGSTSGNDNLFGYREVWSPLA